MLFGTAWILHVCIQFASDIFPAESVFLMERSELIKALEKDSP